MTTEVIGTSRTALGDFIYTTTILDADEACGALAGLAQGLIEDEMLAKGTMFIPGFVDQLLLVAKLAIEANLNNDILRALRVKFEELLRSRDIDIGYTLRLCAVRDLLKVAEAA